MTEEKKNLADKKMANENRTALHFLKKWQIQKEQHYFLNFPFRKSIFFAKFSKKVSTIEGFYY